MLKRRLKRITDITEGLIRTVTTVGSIGERRSDIPHVEPYGFTSAPRKGFLGMEEQTSEDPRQTIITLIRPPNGKQVFLNPGSVAMYTDADNGSDEFHRILLDADTGGIRVHGTVVSLEGSTVSLAGDRIIMNQSPLIAENDKTIYNVPTHWLDCTAEMLHKDDDVVSVDDAAMRFRLQNDTVWVRGNFRTTLRRSQNPLYVTLRLPIDSEAESKLVLGGGFAALEEFNSALFIDENTETEGARIRLPSTHRVDHGGVARTGDVELRCNIEYTYTI